LQRATKLTSSAFLVTAVLTEANMQGADTDAASTPSSASQPLEEDDTIAV
jgi:hypothetical protein